MDEHKPGGATSQIVSVSDAETRLSELLDRVEEGLEIIITRRGQSVARMVPMQTVLSPGDRGETIRKIKSLAARNELRGLSVRELIDEGRR
jgi:prevent-host-death family protein